MATKKEKQQAENLTSSDQCEFEDKVPATSRGEIAMLSRQLEDKVKAFIDYIHSSKMDTNNRDMGGNQIARRAPLCR